MQCDSRWTEIVQNSSVEVWYLIHFLQIACFVDTNLHENVT